MFATEMDGESTKEERILDAAMDEFTEKGWGGARMQSIADRAEINKPLLHYYFRSKENLYSRIIEKVMGFFFVSVGKINTEQEDFEEFLKEFIAALVDGASSNPRLPLFLMQELSRKGKTVRLILRSLFQEDKETPPFKMIRRIQQEMDKGTIKAMDPVQFMLTLIGSCLYFAMAEPILLEILDSGLLFKKPFIRKDFIEERKRSIFQMLYYGIKR